MKKSSFAIACILMLAVVFVGTIGATSVTVVRLSEPYKGHIPGEEAAFSDAEAAQIIAAGIGTAVRTISALRAIVLGTDNGYTVVQVPFVADGTGAVEAVTSSAVYGRVSKVYVANDDIDPTADVIVTISEVWASPQSSYLEELGRWECRANTDSLRVATKDPAARAASRLKIEVAGALTAEGAGATGILYVVMIPE